MFNQFKNDALKREYLSYVNELYKDWPIESKDCYIDTSYGSTFVREIGDGPVLVLLPGTNGGSIMYKDIITTLSKRFKVFAIDIIGDFGKSISSLKLTNTNDYINWQEEVYTSLGITGKFSIAGVSMGAWLAALYSTFSPNVENLVLISPVSVVENLSLKSTLFGIIPMIIPTTGRFFMRKYFRDYLNIFDIDKFEKEIYGPIDMVKRAFKPSPPVVPKKFTKEMVSKIEAKTLYIVGKNELLYNYKRGVDYFNECFDYGSAEVFNNGGHDLFPLMSKSLAIKVIDFCLS